MYLFGGWTGSLLNDLHFINGEAKSGKRMVSAYEPQPPLQLPQPPLRLHRHLPPPQALLARQALQVPQARQVQLLPAVAQVPLLLRHRHLPPPQALLARQAQAPLLLRHRHLPPPQALLARQAQVPQARQVQLLPAVAQVPLLLRADLPPVLPERRCPRLEPCLASLKRRHKPCYATSNPATSRYTATSAAS
eukprot:symbB.v1.2.022572.t1/scaffold1978.1/size96278/1